MSETIITTKSGEAITLTVSSTVNHCLHRDGTRSYWQWAEGSNKKRYKRTREGDAQWSKWKVEGRVSHEPLDAMSAAEISQL